MSTEYKGRGRPRKSDNFVKEEVKEKKSRGRPRTRPDGVYKKQEKKEEPMKINKLFVNSDYVKHEDVKRWKKEHKEEVKEYHKQYNANVVKNRRCARFILQFADYVEFLMTE